MKKLISILAGSLVLVIGLIIVGYPFISNMLMSMNADSEVQNYLNTTSSASADTLNKELKKAQKYNKGLLGNVDLGDPFSQQDNKKDNYYNILNLEGNSVMASLEIPSINIKLPIYHGTSSEVLEKGIGHMRNTSFPVGGKGTHSVLTGHTGASNFKTFTDLNKLKKGDKFYIYVLNQVLAYEVDNIAVVLPSDTSLLKIDENKDQVTLVTCTPYGVNSHRLLVRGKRIPYSAQEEKAEFDKTTESTYNEQYIIAIAIGLGVMILILIVYFTLRAIIRKVRKSNVDEEKNN